MPGKFIKFPIIGSLLINDTTTGKKSLHKPRLPKQADKSKQFKCYPNFWVFYKYDNDAGEEEYCRG